MRQKQRQTASSKQQAASSKQLTVNVLPWEHKRSRDSLAKSRRLARHAASSLGSPEAPLVVKVECRLPLVFGYRVEEAERMQERSTDMKAQADTWSGYLPLHQPERTF